MRPLSQFVSSLLDEFGHDRVDVLGYSFGGALAQQLALDSPTRVRRLVLAATNSGAVSLPGTPRAFMHLLSPRCYYSTAHLERVLPVIAGGRTARDSEQPKRDAKARVALPPTLWGYQSQLVAIAGWTSAFWLQHLTQSTLVLSGDDDPLVPLANARFLARRIPDARLHVVAGGGHLFLIDQPRDAAPVLNAFLACPDTGATPWSNHRQT
jgi:pimeloyl-ACP methyl ester carboxylesterase